MKKARDPLLLGTEAYTVLASTYTGRWMGLDFYFAGRKGDIPLSKWGSGKETAGRKLLCIYLEEEQISTYRWVWERSWKIYFTY